MTVLFGLAAALTYGAADFIGGVVTRRVNVLSVVFLSQLVGSAVLVVALPFFPAPVTPEALGWGAAAGIAGAIGVLLLYRGLATGRMSVVAPITAVEAAAVPVVFGLMAAERPSATASAGVVLALVSVALISAASAPSTEGPAVADRWAGVPEALGAGLAFGAFFILLDNSGDMSGLWPLVGTKLSSVALIAALALASRTRLRAERRAWGPIAAAGVLDLLANLFYLLAVREGLLSLVAVLTSMYPAATVILARVVLGERVSARQTTGFAVAIAGVVLIASG